jgi:flagellar assembly protein FliH
MSTPFAFDTEFDADGSVVRESTWKPTKRSYLPAEVDALVAHAQLEARQQALNEIENIRAMALTNIAQGVAAALPSLLGLRMPTRMWRNCTWPLSTQGRASFHSWLQ